MRSFSVLLAVVGSVKAVYQTGQTINVQGIEYYVAPNSVSIIDLTADQKSAASRGQDFDLVPLTVLADPTNLFTTSVFGSLVANYTTLDDVFNLGFLQVVYLTHSGSGSANVQYPLGAALTKYGTQLFMNAREYTASATKQGQAITGWRTAIPSGPYFMSASTGDVYQAFRLYSDVQSAFTEGTIANTDGTYSPLTAAVSGYSYATIGVPSRLYYKKTSEKPLSGVRIGIKDIYDIAGLKTGCGNRAYFDLYPERSTTAPAVQKLISAGAVVVGKMKTSQFANGETATADWVDQFSPFNARGDGYQDPSASSSGPGAGIGAYSWLDIALGSDTGGSIRGPSQSNGCFGNRPSWGLVTLDNAMPLSPVMDTAGFLCRDPILHHAASKVLYGDNISSTNFRSFPAKLVTSGFPTSEDSSATAVLFDFVAKLQAFLGAKNATALDLSGLWFDTKPAAANDSVLSSYMSTVYPILIAQQQYTQFTLPFYADYAAAHGGRKPFINPVPLIRWAYGQSFPPTSAEEADTKRKIFRDWWAENVSPRNDETCSDNLILYPGILGRPNYRNRYLSAPSIPTGFSINRASNFAELPDHTFLIGQAPYTSIITQQQEYLPVTVQIVAAKGCDGMLFELAEKLLEKGILKVPKTGSMTY
ncbi:putative Glutamyl-tRNA amidotransferase subunit A [Bisporella sp. PMI_857]|nr:putative Glutamyl-tRNA amidotransferase subunit A [Bisporella sp. PMI_857]